MKIVGCDLHARQQTIAMVDTGTGEFSERTLNHEGNAARLWSESSPDQKQRLQKLIFPAGVLFAEGTYRTSTTRACSHYRRASMMKAK